MRAAVQGHSCTAHSRGRRLCRPEPEEPALTDIDDALRSNFPSLQGFRPGQREALEAVLAGSDVVAVLPTGGGKTLVYQLAGAILGGATVVATPLIALMQDQVRRLRGDAANGEGGGGRPEHPDAPAEAERVESLSGSVRGEARKRLLADLEAGNLDFLFATPEQLSRDDVRAALGKAPIRLFCVDEAHCISEWGFDFRPAYRELATAAEAMGRPPILAMTATAPEAVRHDVARELKLRDPVLVARGFDRPNLHFGVVRVTDPDRRDRQLAKLLAEVGRPAVVYCTTRRESEETAFALLELGVAAGHYHGGMERGLREEVQEAFLSDEPNTLDVLCATSAFGMGIDKPDIRAVVHRTMPDSLEAYWQEAGRAGRDGDHADCVLIYRPEDRSVHEHLHRRSRPSETTVAKMVHLFSQVHTATPEADVLARVAAEASVARSGAASLLEDLARFGYITEFRNGIRWKGDPSAAMEDMAAHQVVQSDIEQSRLDMVAAYAESTNCRRRYLLNYLGDEYPGELCLRCDNCLRRAEQRGTDDWDVDAQEERVQADREGPFATGASVTHPEWGAGTVQRTEGDVLVVRFDSVGYRSMHAPTVVERNLLQPA
ncbi:MAG TPA: RecQ family ATP-dependent DNA helicase [Egibacteraceae bacterium]|jgi:ATP-dependent DNA helicase RecQ|nr:RecQ family ATP-dependent DNA helicase [Egibacteraceae bacterium]